MAANGVEADGSMGNDTPIAALSERPQLLFNYFKQGFAQVTNPPIDSIREDSVMSLISTIGAERSVTEETPEHARLLELEQPILSAEELEKIRQVDHPWLRAATIDCTFEPPENGDDSPPATRLAARSTGSARRRRERARRRVDPRPLRPRRGPQRAPCRACSRPRRCTTTCARGPAHVAAAASSRPATRARSRTSRS
jgi:hypothetical protein